MPYFIVLILLLMPLAQASDDAAVLKVAIKPSEPWVMYDASLPDVERVPQGFSIDLWTEIAKNLGKETEWVFADSTTDLIKRVEVGTADAGISAITIRSDREAVIDFSGSMYELGLQIMVSADQAKPSPLGVLFGEVKRLVSVEGLLIFALFLYVTMNLRWFAEMRVADSTLFSRNYFKGMYDTFWWALTMLITWETPKSKGLSRVIDLGWHLMGLIGLSILTALVTASLTAKAVGGAINTAQDLPGKRVAAVATDAPKDYLNKIGALVEPVTDLQQGMALLREGKVDALVHDGPRLVYLANQHNGTVGHKELMVLPAVFNPQNYGIVFPSGSEYVEPVNRVLLSLREAEGLQDSFHEALRKKWIKN